MTTLQRQFLELLKAGLWGNVPDINLFQSSVDWNGILRIAAGHTVQVIIADGIELLPETTWPPKDAIMKLMMVRTKTRQMHSLINATLNKIVNALNAENIPSVLLKGQGVAQNYRNPESRMCEDIDLYVGVNNFSKACDIVKNMGDGTFEGEESEQHTHLRLDNVEIEIHRVVQHLANRSLNKKFHRLTVENIDDNFGTSELGVWNNNGTEIMLSPATFDSFFILHPASRYPSHDIRRHRFQAYLRLDEVSA